MLMKTSAILAAAMIAAPFGLSGPAEPRQVRTVTADEIVVRPGQYLGREVRVRASVDDVYSRAWFSIDDDSDWSTGRDLLVVNPAAIDRADDGTEVVITGHVVTFTEVELKDRMSDRDLDLGPDLVVQFDRRPVLVAESIVTDEGRELVRADSRSRRDLDDRPVHEMPVVAAETVRTSEVADDIEEYVGRHVRIESDVDRLYSRSVFTVDDGVVVIASGLDQAVGDDMDLAVIGTVGRFSRDVIERELDGYSLDLLPLAERELMNRPVILARSVRTEAGVELMGPMGLARRR